MLCGCADVRACGWQGAGQLEAAAALLEDARAATHATGTGSAALDDDELVALEKLGAIRHEARNVVMLRRAERMQGGGEGREEGGGKRRGGKRQGRRRRGGERSSCATQHRIEAWKRLRAAYHTHIKKQENKRRRWQLLTRRITTARRGVPTVATAVVFGGF